MALVEEIKGDILQSIKCEYENIRKIDEKQT